MSMNGPIQNTIGFASGWSFVRQRRSTPEPCSALWIGMASYGQCCMWVPDLE
ncbi:MAG: hypothetical protein NTX27_21815 [Verrucomicrobia bacterium]|nr:hypothetical protein [Verrucomicrobiota bacterium]